MDEIFNVGNAIKLAQASLEFTLARVDDWQNVVPDGKALRKECELFQALIKDVLDKEYLPIAEILSSVSTTLTETKKDIDRFMEDDTKKRSAFSKMGWKIKRSYLAWEYRDTFKATTTHLETSKQKIKDTLDLSAKVSKPTVHWYRNDMINHESYLFWKEICGEELQAPDGSTWTLFVQSYQQKHGVDWDANIIERLRRVACSDGSTNFALPGFIVLTKHCGFPLNLEKLPSLMDSHATVSAQTRMEVAKMINELITYYSTKEMRDLIVAIYTWFKGYNKRDKKAWQERANEWARTLLDNRTKAQHELDESGQLAEQVDMARRTYSFFFQRYMVVFKIGQLSKEIFAEVDFPGKARMFEFIEFVGPLDEANYHIVIRGDPKEWSTKKPKVYHFLDDYIRTEKAAKKLAKQKKLEEAQPSTSVLASPSASPPPLIRSSVSSPFSSNGSSNAPLTPASSQSPLIPSSTAIPPINAKSADSVSVKIASRS